MSSDPQNSSSKHLSEAPAEGETVDHDAIDPSYPIPTEDEAFKLLLHCHAPFVAELPEDARTVYDWSKGPPANFEYAEHSHLGDSLLLKWHDGNSYFGKNKKIRLENGLEVTYGQINGLGGDFFGGEDPISGVNTLDDQVNRFNNGYYTLAIRSESKGEAESLINQLQGEVDMFNDALQSGKPPYKGFKSFLRSSTDNLYSSIKGWWSGREKGYLGLALINYDHFGEEARKAYNAGHTAALRLAAACNKDPLGLERAYARNAFADHFLQDSFAAGHIRVPRTKLTSSYPHARDKCAHHMHHEDGKYGLTVGNPLGDWWVMYGDQLLLDHQNKKNLEICKRALAVSVQEVYDAWSTGHVPSPDAFGAWKYAPILDSAWDEKNHVAMFNKDGIPRKKLLDRWHREYEKPNGWWTYAGIAAAMTFVD
ncbi:phosphatidylcholine-hydrolyzing phospholipase c [Podospora fimiseda]|uniref:Phosphatidylcholine-hydrolyzing phospholipase c n=1 Tax=Podospora fimiseda TaxID=252190 RepID=A0AAN6YQC8_9PEZI|nr:phosphatidylcholine-hydrolyzing phospholipase c [Podospora fimiseda]